MKKTSKQLREERAAIGNKIAELSVVETRSENQTTELENALIEERRLGREIELALELEKRDAEKVSAEARKAAASGIANVNSEDKELRNFSLSKLIVEAESRNISGLEKEVIEEYQSEAREIGFSGKGIYLGTKLMDALVKPEKRAMTAAAATAGGNFIPTEKQGFFDALFAATVLDMLGVQKLTGLSANMDLTGFTSSVTSAWAAGETGTQTATDPTTAARELRPKLLYTASDISRRLMIQTNPSIDQFVLQNMIKSMAVAFEAAVINGTGAYQPSGILGAGIGSVAMGTNGGAPTYAKILELIQTNLTANGANVARKFVTNPKVVAKLKQTVLDSGSGAMVMGYNGLFNSQVGVIDGYEVAVTSNVPSNLDKGASTGVCSALIFGDFSQVVTGQFGGIELIVDPYSAARTGTIKYTINQFLDSTVLQPAALTAIADLTT